MVYYSQAGQEIEDAEMDNMRQATITVIIRAKRPDAVLGAMAEVGLDRFDGPDIRNDTRMAFTFAENDEMLVRQWISAAFACGLILSGRIER